MNVVVRRIRPFVCLVLAVGLIAACDSGPTIVIPPDLTPRMTVAQVTDRVLELIHQNEAIAGRVAKAPRILQITAKPGIVWFVRAEGTFTNNRYPPGAKPPVATSGYYEISDADGGVLGFGFP
jgi:hypothetical protein